MELKQRQLCVVEKPLNLLIVPYGIETKIHGMTIHYRYLLIVPYGIETHRTDPKKPAPARF